MPSDDESAPGSEPEETDLSDEPAPIIGGGVMPPVAEARSASGREPATSELPALEAEAFLVPSWTEGVAVKAVAEKPDRSRRLIREIIETALLALLVFLAVRASLQNYLVEGYSMFPTLDHGQHILVNKLGYAEVNMDRLTDFIPFVDTEEGDVRQVFGGPARGDIIVFESSAGTGNDLIKRVIALPGERIEIVQGRVYINGQLLNEPYITEVWSDTRPEILIPARHYYVLGDNRNSSQDSRSGRIGLVPRERIVGKALLRYWPFDSFGLAPNGGAELTGTAVSTPSQPAEPDEPAEPSEP
ncbi:MAG: signal peptidase I [Chloroflexota bacterium]|nr:signal peptidase I [Chloroflexota bacterium]